MVVEQVAEVRRVLKVKQMCLRIYLYNAVYRLPKASTESSSGVEASLPSKLRHTSFIVVEPLISRSISGNPHHLKRLLRPSTGTLFCTVCSKGSLEKVSGKRPGSIINN